MLYWTAQRCVERLLDNWDFAIYRYTLDYPAERERWFRFKQERLHQRILDWLEAQGITPADDH